MDWIKRNYDRVILVLLGVVAIACAGVIIASALSFNEIFASRNSSQPPSKKFDEPATERVKQRLELAKSPSQWLASDGSLFVSVPYVVNEAGELIKPTGPGQPPIHPPVENKWLFDYQLPWDNPDVLQMDPDGDGFNNLEEFLAHTNPLETKSKPFFASKLRLREFIKKPFRLKFSGIPGGGDIYSINTRDLRSPTQFVRIGEMIEGTPYKVLSYEQKNVRRESGVEVDISELVIENQEDMRKVVLVLDQEVDDPTHIAKFVYLYDNSELQVKKGEEFSVKPEEHLKYKLIDISETEALIQQAGSDQQIKVPAEKQ
jgi:hypothetical protein